MSAQTPKALTHDKATIYPFAFTGTTKEYFKIWIVNVLLTIVTLGIYSVWAKVRTKRYLYKNTLLKGTSFEYHGTPMKILLGYLIALGLVLIYELILPYFISMLFAEVSAVPIRLGDLQFAIELEDVESILEFLGLLILFWVPVLARMFTARLSSYQSIRFDFKTTWWEAFKVLFVLGLLGVITIVGYPYFAYRRAEFFVNHSRYGTAPFALAGKLKTFYAIYFKAFLIMLGGLIFIVAAGFAILFINENRAFIDDFLKIVLSVCLGPLFWVFYVATSSFLNTSIANCTWSNTTVGKSQFIGSPQGDFFGKIQVHKVSVSTFAFNCSLKVNRVIWIRISNTLASLLSLGLLIPWGTIRMETYRLSCLSLLTASDTETDQFIRNEKEKSTATGEAMADIYNVTPSMTTGLEI
jgi:uncharacterized membrane protein YjgN (DUF898 family)